jgi:hypothetical protein
MNWISVKEKLPPKKTWVYGYLQYTYKVLCNQQVVCHQGNGVWTSGQNEIDNITHWMPLHKKPTK